MELQTYKGDNGNRLKTGKDFNKMDKQNIKTIREDLADNFCALA